MSQLNPEPIVVYEYKNVAEIPPRTIQNKEGRKRSNNRKTTKNRKYQTIQVMDSSVFPPKFYTKIIKHK